MVALDDKGEGVPRVRRYSIGRAKIDISMGWYPQMKVWWVK